MNKKTLFLIASCMLNVVLVINIFRSTTHDEGSINTTYLKKRQIPDETRASISRDIETDPLGNGCSHVFIDAGSNRGVHGRFLFEPETYNQSTFTQKFTEIYGSNRTLQNMCVFAFEPNPMHTKPQSDTQAAYTRMGWRYHYMPFGVSDGDGQLTFYRNYDVIWGALAEEWGFSTKLQGAAVKDQEVLVNVIDFSQWLDHHVLKRDIPEKNEFNLGPPLIVMKMDIEGSEYAVLEHMIDTGTAYRVNYIFGEWHPVPQLIKGQNYSTPEELGGLSLSLASRLLENDGPGFVNFDNEEYLHDGMEYPVSMVHHGLNSTVR
jgi:hypothetical protein